MNAVRPLNRFLRELHGPTPHIGQTMCALVPFPTQIASLADADLLDLSIAVDVDQQSLHKSTAVVEAAARYATRARMIEVEHFYLGELTAANATITSQRVLGDGGRVVIDAILDDLDKTSFQVLVDDFRGYRSVRVTAGYKGFDHLDVFAQFANWHNGTAPVAVTAEPSGVDISTFASGRQPQTLVLYSTRYATPDTSRTAQRAVVDDRLAAQGWTTREPREGILFVQHGPFDAEIHLHGDAHDSQVTFVGEFVLR